MRIHENGFSFFGGAQRGNAAAGQALTMSVASDWKLKKKKRRSVVCDRSSETNEGLFEIRRQIKFSSSVMVLIEVTSTCENILRTAQKKLTTLLQLGRDQRQSSTIINELHSF